MLNLQKQLPSPSPFPPPLRFSIHNTLCLHSICFRRPTSGNNDVGHVGGNEWMPSEYGTRTGPYGTKMSAQIRKNEVLAKKLQIPSKKTCRQNFVLTTNFCELFGTLCKTYLQTSNFSTSLKASVRRNIRLIGENELIQQKLELSRNVFITL